MADSDLVSLAQQQKESVVFSLPKADLIISSDPITSSLAASKNNENRRSRACTSESPSSSSELVLMQLPKGTKMEDLVVGCYFLATKCSSTDTSRSSINDPTSARQTAFVVESNEQSFSISRLETSNVVVLAPPVKRTVQLSRNTRNERSASKKKQLDRNNINGSMGKVPARLLKAGGSGASFLELRPKLMRSAHLSKILENHVFDPYTHNRSNSRNYQESRIGRTIQSLAYELLCSTGEIRKALALLKSFPMPEISSCEDLTHNKHNCFGFLSEEALCDAQSAIISTLAESDDFSDYASRGVKVDEFIRHVIDRLLPPWDPVSVAGKKHIIRYALATLVADENIDKSQQRLLDVGSVPGKVLLDVKKIAVCLCHRLFQAQSTPWEEERLFLRWQSELPGVGRLYKTSLEMLRGVAIPVDSYSSSRKPCKGNATKEGEMEEEKNRLWKYFPSDKLPMEPKQRFQTLFATRKQWALEDLSPYLDGLVKETGLSQAEILIQYTTTTQGYDGDGKLFKLYGLKG